METLNFVYLFIILLFAVAFVITFGVDYLHERTRLKEKELDLIKYRESYIRQSDKTDRIYDVAATLLAVEEEDDEAGDEENERTRNTWFVHWRKHLPTFQGLPHDGDCVGVPMGCSRCLHDEYVERAKKMIEDT